MSPRLPRTLPRRHGFTLVELLVAMVVALAVIGGAFTVFNALSRQWQSNSGLIRSRAEARLAMDVLRRDLMATVRSAPGDWLYLRPGTVAAAGAPVSNELYLLSTSPDRVAGEDGDVWALGYALAVADPFEPGGPAPRRGLYRLRIKPTEVFADGIETDKWWQNFWQPRRPSLDASANLLADGAIFLCEAVVEERATKNKHRVPLDRQVRAHAGGVTIEPALGALSASGLRLAAVEVTIVILRFEGATMLRDRQSLTPEQWRRSGDTFSERINF